MTRIRLTAIALTLSACTSEPATDAEIHEVTQCDDNWSGHLGVVQYGSCEMPCADLQQLGSRSSCEYETSAGAILSCAPGQFIEWEGRTGCWVVDGAGQDVVFAECG